MKITGGCHCGAITYEAEVDPGKVSVCHCTDCQTLTGSAFRIVVPAKREGFKLKGEPKIAPFWAVLRHVVNHGTYHRGQISSMVKRVGGKPISTDMVVWGIEANDKGR